MIKIVKDNIELIVTKGAYENSFKNAGYTVVTEKPKDVFKEAKIVEEVVEKPAEKPAVPQKDSKITKPSK